MPDLASFIDALRNGGFPNAKPIWGFEYGPEGYCEVGRVPDEEKASLADLEGTTTAKPVAYQPYRGKVKP